MNNQSNPSVSNSERNDQVKMHIEVVFALPKEQHVIDIEVPEQSTVDDAIRESKIMEKYPEIDLDVNKTGIFGKPAKRDAVLHAGDRVEIYRPLLCDPKEMRKLRAKEGKETRSGA
ncbi:MAG: RnfH family protein [Arenicellales bacterium]|jgi:putative ubiquitin-RnfH superfamily antitoxin RatB of RatAB toxin-antitoxin module